MLYKRFYTVKLWKLKTNLRSLITLKWYKIGSRLVLHRNYFFLPHSSLPSPSPLSPTSQPLHSHHLFSHLPPLLLPPPSLAVHPLCYGTVVDIVVGIVIHLYTEWISYDNLCLVDGSFWFFNTEHWHCFFYCCSAFHTHNMTHWLLISRWLI